MADWTRLTPLPTDYISDKLRLRQGDRVWRVPRHDGPDLYLLLMLEHQSTSDAYMALSMHTYRGLLYESLLHYKLVSARQRLPAVLPMVIYSGVPRWTAALNVFDLIDAAPRPA